MSFDFLLAEKCNFYLTFKDQVQKPATNNILVFVSLMSFQNKF